ncbi:acyl-CoA thioesterase [Azonexus sp.]|jgi:acyl-CoA thioester hydrolase|uniref:acyl-CoA thioesterase n=1 Tax=Azonexus sp. TaxID=1872668 RepID=UPI002835A35D|nr:acyl-CoA thioesterase [Azonexus sp.]MDR1994332.1 acyl-CoA thioesterase [Azonexus sp.]
MRKRGVLATDIQIKVPFYDVDMVNIVWHGHYAKYLEDARCALFDAIGYNYDDMFRDGYVWPIIDMHLRYVQPAKFKQILNVRAELIEWQERLVVNYLISDAQTGQRLTRAATTQVAVRMATQEMLYASPPQLLSAVELALANRNS